MKKPGYQIAIDAFLVILCLLWTFFAGKDLNWDLRNYHFYLPYSLIEGRVSQDFLPTSIQSYLNPISYLPFYWMVKLGWPSLVIAAVLAVLHSVNLMLLWRISRELFGSTFRAVIAFVLGALAPIYWVEVGTSFNDVIISSLIMAGIYYGLKSLGPAPYAGSMRLLFSGFFLGAAVALKLTAAPFALSGVVFAVLALKNARETSLRVGALVVGGVIGLFLFGGYWYYTVWREFGNPLFPFFNRIFCSPDFLCANITASRFLPGSIFAAVVLPFEIATPISWTYTETVSPDLRYVAILMAFGICVAGLVFGAKFRRHWIEQKSATPFGLPLVFYFGLSWIIWCITSANGRYALPIGLIAGPVLVDLLSRIFSRHLRVVVGVLVALQSIQLAITADARWSSAEWKNDWFELKIPIELQKRPYLYLSIGQQSNGFVAPYLHRDSAYVNIVGQVALSTASFGGERLQSMLQNHRGSIRMLSTIDEKILIDGRPNEMYVKEINILLSNVHPNSKNNLMIDERDCVTLSSQASSKLLQTSEMGKGKQVFPYLMISCLLSEVPRKIEDGEELATAKRTMEYVEAACPNLFTPIGAVIERTIKGYRRYYVGTEISLQISQAGHVYLSKTRVPNDYDLGRVEDWKNGKPANRECPRLRRSAPWFSVADQVPREF